MLQRAELKWRRVALKSKYLCLSSEGILTY